MGGPAFDVDRLFTGCRPDSSSHRPPPSTLGNLRHPTSRHGGGNSWSPSTAMASSVPGGFTSSSRSFSGCCGISFADLVRIPPDWPFQKTTWHVRFGESTSHILGRHHRLPCPLPRSCDAHHRCTAEEASVPKQKSLHLPDQPDVLPTLGATTFSSGSISSNANPG